MRVAGVVLIALGILALLYGGISVMRTHKVGQVGPVKAYETRRETHAIPPVVGGAAVVAGLVLLVSAGTRRTA